MKKLSSFHIKYFATSIIFFSGALFSLIVFLLTGGNGKDIVPSLDGLFSNPIIYIMIISEMIGFSLSLANYKVNGNNIKAINFSLIFSLVLVPLYGFFGDQLGIFPEGLKVNYKNNIEFVLFLSVMMVLSTLFFIDKVKTGAINNIYLLMAYPLVLSFTMYLSGNLIQSHNGFLVYSVITFSMAVLFFIMSFVRREIKEVRKKDFVGVMPLVGIWLCVVPLNIFAMKFLAIEFVTMIKRVCQILVGIILDKHFKSIEVLSKKDLIIIIFIALKFKLKIQKILKIIDIVLLSQQ